MRRANPPRDGGEGYAEGGGGQREGRRRWRRHTSAQREGTEELQERKRSAGEETWTHRMYSERTRRHTQTHTHTHTPSPSNVISGGGGMERERQENARARRRRRRRGKVRAVERARSTDLERRDNEEQNKTRAEDTRSGVVREGGEAGEREAVRELGHLRGGRGRNQKNCRRSRGAGGRRGRTPV